MVAVYKLEAGLSPAECIIGRRFSSAKIQQRSLQSTKLNTRSTPGFVAELISRFHGFAFDAASTQDRLALDSVRQKIKYVSKTIRVEKLLPVGARDEPFMSIRSDAALKSDHKTLLGRKIISVSSLCSIEESSSMKTIPGSTQLISTDKRTEINDDNLIRTAYGGNPEAWREQWSI